jgi:hypothetical protein
MYREEVKESNPLMKMPLCLMYILICCACFCMRDLKVVRTLGRIAVRARSYFWWADI